MAVEEPAPGTARLGALPPGAPSLLSARPGPALPDVGYVEQELLATGEATAYAPDGPVDRALPADGRYALRPAGTAPYATRVLVRRPADPAAASGTVVVEWLNVSSGQDAAPDWTYLAEEVVRRGHAWVGVSAQHAGVEGGRAAVAVGSSPGLKGSDPQRYAALQHPGDAYCYDVFSQVGRALRAPDAPLGGVGVDCLLAVGESQSAFALTTYVDGVHPLVRVHDGFLVHSRGGAAAPLGEPDRGFDMSEVVTGRPTRIREDLDVPVIVLQTETDLFGRLGYLPARQPDAALLRVWEVAGAAHADRFQIGEFEELLGSPWQVNRGQQAYVVRAALRHLESWARTGRAAPAASPLEVRDGAFVTDEDGNVRGGVRTPVVDAPVEVLSGLVPDDAPLLVQLLGRTTPWPAERVRERYGTEAGYAAAYLRAVDDAVAAGFVLPEDRAEVLAERRGFPAG